MFWSVVVPSTLWIPLLALEAGYPSLQQVLQVPSLTRLLLFATGAAVTIVLACSLPSYLATRLTMAQIGGGEVAGAAVSFGTVAGSAIFITFAAVRVHRGPGSLTDDLRATLVDLLVSAVLGALFGALSLAETLRSERTWVTFALTAGTAFWWAYVARGLIGVNGSGRPIDVWWIAGGACFASMAANTRGRRRALAGWVAVALLLAAVIPAMKFAGPAGTGGPRATEGRLRPNVVLVVVDTWRYDPAGPTGGGLQTTPRLAALARARATEFRTAIAPASATLPSVKAMITGQPASHFGPEGLGVDPPPPHAWVMAEAFRRAGYATAAFVANGLVSSGGFEKGFDRYWCVGVNRSLERSFFVQAFLARRQYWQTQRVGEALGVAKTEGTAAVGQFEEWVKTPRPPFFAYVHLVEPHWPYRDPDGDAPGFSEIAGRLSHVDLVRLRMGDPANSRLRQSAEFAAMTRRYAGEVKEADRLVGRLADVLRGRGLLENTVLIVVGDHGEEFTEHDGFGHGHDVYEEIVHVPFVICWPRDSRFAAFAPVVDSPVTLTAIFPTLTDLLALPQPRRPFAFPSLRGELTGARESASPVFTETVWSGGRFGYRRGSMKVRLEFDPRRPLRITGVQVFDLAADPAERRPLTARDAAVQALEREAAETLVRLWKRKSVRPSDPARKERDWKQEDEALERLRALGYLG